MGVKIEDARPAAAPQSEAVTGSAKPLPEGMEIGKQGAITPLMGSFTVGALRMESGTDARESIATRVAAVGNSLAQIETEQSTALAKLERKLSVGPARFRAVLSDIGLDADRFRATVKKARSIGGVGGPLMPLTGESGDFAERVNRIQSALAEQSSIGQAMQSIPLRRPVPNDTAITSGFGARSDPFLARAAMHTGVDFRGDIGDAARATAPGRITSVGYNGGYGNMVEIDHGFGITTRYAHLSAFDVEVGDIVAKGQVIGRIGSTGRSTGPHLHYETRIDGEAVDPMRFLRAARRMSEG
jgi:murein DD-endopeptidase MepM/ murein hydrolase activator NlpD